MFEPTHHDLYLFEWYHASSGWFEPNTRVWNSLRTSSRSQRDGVPCDSAETLSTPIWPIVVALVGRGCVVTTITITILVLVTVIVILVFIFALVLVIVIVIIIVVVIILVAITCIFAAARSARGESVSSGTVSDAIRSTNGENRVDLARFMGPTHFELLVWRL